MIWAGKGNAWTPTDMCYSSSQQSTLQLLPFMAWSDWAVKWETFVGCSTVLVALPSLAFQKSAQVFFFLLSLEPMSSKIEKTSYSFLILLIHALHPAAPLCSFTLLKRDKKMLYKKKLSTGQVAKFSRCFVLLWSWQRSVNCLETSVNSSINLIIG